MSSFGRLVIGCVKLPEYCSVIGFCAWNLSVGGINRCLLCILSIMYLVQVTYVWDFDNFKSVKYNTLTNDQWKLHYLGQIITQT